MDHRQPASSPLSPPLATSAASEAAAGPLQVKVLLHVCNIFLCFHIYGLFILIIPTIGRFRCLTLVYGAKASQVCILAGYAVLISTAKYDLSTDCTLLVGQHI